MTGEATGPNQLYRLPSRGWLGGVCAGLSDRFRLDLTAIRIIAVILAVGSGGLAALVYLVAWAVMPPAEPVADSANSAPESQATAEGAPAGSWRWRRTRAEAVRGESRVRRPRNGAIRLGLGVTLLTLGILLAFREVGLWWSDAVVWPIVIAAGGAALVLRQIQVSGETAEAADTETIADLGAGTEAAPEPAVPTEAGDRTESLKKPGRVRAALRLYRGGFGIALILAAAVLFLYANGVFGEVSDAALVVVAVAAAVGLIVTPFLLAMTRRAREERRQRIRSEERAEVAAHLHDSVLQTLAMIQRRSGDSAEIATLARQQERELRAWLSGRGDEERSASLASALDEAAAEVEEAYRVPIETVTVGDRPLNRRGEAVVAATREAITNAARFAGDSDPDATVPVSLYAELSGDGVAVFIRDRGPGFDLDSIPPDRRGVRESIIGRMERHGGSATIRSRPGEGTEVELTMEFS